VGLDVYAGTMTRYLTGDWELATEKAAREMGLELQVERLNEPEDVVTDPEEVRAAVLEWREALADTLELPLAWSEDDDMPYFTDKPDWSGYGALLLFAAHQEHPEIPLPQELPPEPFDHPLFKAVTGSAKRGLLPRRKEPEQPPRYASLYGTELWLPVDTEAVWTAPFLNGEMVTTGSTQALHADLNDLVRRLGASPEELDEWRRSGGVGEVIGTVEIDGRTFEQLAPGSVDELARFALAVFVELTEQAVDHRLPMKLDY
jgi:hypothetical protein